MDQRTTITVKEFCHYHQIEFSFIQSLHEYGLVEVDTPGDEEWLLYQDQLEQIERLVRLHYDLQINLEGLDAVHHLLQRMEAMQREMSLLRNRLKLYEVD